MARVRVTVLDLNVDRNSHLLALIVATAVPKTLSENFIVISGEGPFKGKAALKRLGTLLPTHSEHVHNTAPTLPHFPCTVSSFSFKLRCLTRPECGLHSMAVKSCVACDVMEWAGYPVHSQDDLFTSIFRQRWEPAE